MQTVIRAISKAGDAKQLKSFGEMMNSAQPGIFSNLSKRGCRFAIEICFANTWSSHLKHLEQFLMTFETILLAAKEHEVDLVVDVAVSSADLVDQTNLLVGILPSITRRLAKIEAEFRVTIYNLDYIGAGKSEISGTRKRGHH